MRTPGFKGFLASYVGTLSRQKTMSLYRLSAEAASSNPRLREPLFLYALMNDKLPVLLQATKDAGLHQEYAQMANRFSKATMVEALSRKQLAPEYQKVYDSYISVANRYVNENHTKNMMRSRIIRLKDSKGVSAYRLHKDLGINQGNLNAYLTGGNTDKVSLSTARRVLDYLSDNE